MKTAELLAPAGSKEAFYAAIAAGANAIYLAGKQFGARAYADNFTNEEIKELIACAHLYGVNVYVTINTLVFDEEFLALDQFVSLLQDADCDAIIVQDIGVLHFIAKRYPEMPIHASTQMNIKTVEEARFLKSLGVKRIVLARELSLVEIKKIKEEVDIELEIFIHGALCVSASGNCYLSSFIGKRSGNRGRCAQPCRLPYTLANKDAYWLSTKDLSTIDNVMDLIELGVDSWKIEGRMKSSTYVYHVVSMYQEAILYAKAKKKYPNTKAIENLQSIFHRGFTKGFLFQDSSESFAQTFAPNHQGIEVGIVVASKEKSILVEISREITQGDGIRIVFDSKEDAIVVNTMMLGNMMVTTAKPGDKVWLLAHQVIPIGAILYRTMSHQLQEMVKEKIKSLPKIKIFGTIRIEENKVVFEVTDGIHKGAGYQSAYEIARNSNQSLRMMEQLKKTHNTPFVLEEVKSSLEVPIFMQIKSINQLRRDALEDFTKQRSKRYHNRPILQIVDEAQKHRTYPTTLVVSVKTQEQLEAIDWNIVSECYVQNEVLLKTWKQNFPELPIYVHEPRMKGSGVTSKSIISSIALIKGNIISPYLPCCNTEALHFYHKQGADTVCVSIECSIGQIQAMMKSYHARFQTVPKIGVFVYGAQEAMVLKHNVLDLATIAKEERLMDRKNKEYRLVKDDFGWQILYHHECLDRVASVPILANINVASLLMVFTNETGNEVKNIIQKYQKALHGIATSEDIAVSNSGHLKEGVY